MRRTHDRELQENCRSWTCGELVEPLPIVDLKKNQQFLFLQPTIESTITIAVNYQKTENVIRQYRQSPKQSIDGKKGTLGGSRRFWPGAG